MLKLNLKPDDRAGAEEVVVSLPDGSAVTFRVLNVKRAGVGVGIEAPRQLPIRRRKIWRKGESDE